MIRGSHCESLTFVLVRTVRLLITVVRSVLLYPPTCKPPFLRSVRENLIRVVLLKQSPAFSIREQKFHSARDDNGSAVVSCRMGAEQSVSIALDPNRVLGPFSTDLHFADCDFQLHIACCLHLGWPPVE